MAYIADAAWCQRCGTIIPLRERRVLDFQTGQQWHLACYERMHP